MNRTYAITWEETGGSPHSGKLEVRASGVSLEGRNGSGPVSLLVPYDQVLGLTVASVDRRLAGRPTLVLARAHGGDIKIASVGSPGTISEMADQVASMRAGSTAAAERVAVVVPLRKGKSEKARRLLDKGPPFDPERVGLESHQVFVSEQEAIFVFNAGSELSLKKLLADSRVWASAAAWSDVIAGPPRIAKPFYAWATAGSPDDLFFAATPGPGDSEGGDIYSPS